MKILLDTCVWGGVKSELLRLGYDVCWTGDLPEDPGDDEILAIAKNEGRILVTLDKAKADEIIQKWIDFFVLHKPINPVTITARL